MKIAMADSNGLKFCADLKEHWEKLGHEVKFELGASEFLAPWADLYYMDEWDHNIHYLFNWYQEHPETKKPMVVVRPLDWTVWIGLVRDQRIIDWVDKAICIAPHIEKKLREDNNWGDKLKLIRPGVNLEKFTLKTKQTDGFQLGMVLGDMWFPKNHMGGLDIFTTLYRQDNRWKFHIRGQHEGGNEFWKVMFDHYLESRGIKDVVTLYERVPDMSEWYENIDILLHPGMKEAFCYAVGEAMAKGIPAVINEFYGSRNIWGFLNHHIYQTHEQAIQLIKIWQPLLYSEKTTEPVFQRKYIENNYSLERQLKETDEYLNLGI